MATILVHRCCDLSAAAWFSAANRILILIAQSSAVCASKLFLQGASADDDRDCELPSDSDSFDDSCSESSMDDDEAPPAKNKHNKSGNVECGAAPRLTMALME